jgi:hypothetical protein
MGQGKPGKGTKRQQMLRTARETKRQRREALEVQRREELEVQRREELEVQRREELEVQRREELEVQRRILVRWKPIFRDRAESKPIPSFLVAQQPAFRRRNCGELNEMRLLNQYKKRFITRRRQ